MKKNNLKTIKYIQLLDIKYLVKTNNILNN